MNIKLIMDNALKYCLNIAKKNRELILYIICGGLTTLLSIGSYQFLVVIFKLHYLLANALSWVISVIFAYFANGRFVFRSLHNSKKQKFFEFLVFLGSRLFSGVLDMFLMYFCVSILYLPGLASKFIVSVIITVVNYVISKFIVFRKGG